MRLSKKGEYALRAMIELGLADRHHYTGIHAIARRQRIPLKFLEQILLALRKTGFVASKRGVGGGVCLARSPHHMTLGEIVRAIDGPLAPLPCASQTAYIRCTDCVDENQCGIRSIMLDVRNAIAKILDRVTLEEACRRSVELAGQRSGLFDYSI